MNKIVLSRWNIVRSGKDTSQFSLNWMRHALLIICYCSYQFGTHVNGCIHCHCFFNFSLIKTIMWWQTKANCSGWRIDMNEDNERKHNCQQAIFSCFCFSTWRMIDCKSTMNRKDQILNICCEKKAKRTNGLVKIEP